MKSASMSLSAPVVFTAAVVSFAGCALALPDSLAAPPERAADVRSLAPIVTQADVVSLPDIAERVVKGVVSVNTEKAMRGNVPSRMGDFTVRGMGSGVVVDRDGTIVTNHHVIDGALEVQVAMADGNTYAATVVGSDPRSDVAVLKMVEPPRDLEPIAWGDSEAVRLGETVLAVGNPYGIGHTLTRGIVSATGRASVGIAEYENFIQTDAAINPGNSGGALVDLNGRLIGIPTAIFSKTGGFSGISLAIPSNMARTIADDILADGKVDRGWLGVVLRESPDGVVLTQIGEDSAASAAGLEPGDLVVSFNGDQTDSLERFRSQVAFAGAGQPFTTVVVRDGAPVTVSGTLGRRPDDPQN
jgi:serine protease Do